MVNDEEIDISMGKWTLVTIVWDGRGTPTCISNTRETTPTLVVWGCGFTAWLMIGDYVVVWCSVRHRFQRAERCEWSRQSVHYLSVVSARTVSMHCRWELLVAIEKLAVLLEQGGHNHHDMMYLLYIDGSRLVYSSMSADTKTGPLTVVPLPTYTFAWLVWSQLCADQNSDCST